MRRVSLIAPRSKRSKPSAAARGVQRQHQNSQQACALSQRRSRVPLAQPVLFAIRYKPGTGRAGGTQSQSQTLLKHWQNRGSAITERRTARVAWIARKTRLRQRDVADRVASLGHLSCPGYRAKSAPQFGAHYHTGDCDKKAGTAISYIRHTHFRSAPKVEIHRVLQFTCSPCLWENERGLPCAT